MTRNDLNVQMPPISGWMATMTEMRGPPAAASALARPNVRRWMRWTSIPHTMATSRLWAVARMALPSRVVWRKRNAAALMTAANPKATSRDFEIAMGPSANDPVLYSTVRRSAVIVTWARVDMA